MNVHTRFAPSPTGLMHVGGVRTALFTWLIARQAKGKFFLRIEDTDKEREVPGSTEQIMASLAWLGLQWDEGPDQAGEYGPYLQSERLEHYQAYAQRLIKAGHAYADPYTEEELEHLRQRAKDEKRPFLFRDHRPENPPEWDGTQPLRLKVPEIKAYEWTDAVRGQLSAGPEALDDFILIKADGFPTYNFAHIVDDDLMKITHVVRGEEFLASTPKFLSLYDALGIKPPIFVTMPPVLGKDGGKKLSKRDGAKSVLEYRDEGYLPEAVFNFLASLGWNDGTEQEVFTKDEILEKFSIERIQRSGAKFDEERLLWLNGSHIRRMPLSQLATHIEDFWPPEAEQADSQYKLAILGLIQERLKFFAEIPELTTFFFKRPEGSAELLNVKQLESRDSKELLKLVTDRLEDSDFTEDDLERRLRNLVEQEDVKTGALFMLIRLAITGQTIAPGLFETLHVFGRDESLQRLRSAQTW